MITLANEGGDIVMAESGADGQGRGLWRCSSQSGNAKT